MPCLIYRQGCGTISSVGWVMYRISCLSALSCWRRVGLFLLSDALRAWTQAIVFYFVNGVYPKGFVIVESFA